MKIYGLFDKRDPDTIVYVGSTCRRLSTRLKNHLYRPSSLKIALWVMEIGRENVGIRKLEQCDILDRVERESWHISQYSGLLNTRIPQKHPSDLRKSRRKRRRR